MRIYDGALSADDVLDLYHGINPLMGTATGGLPSPGTVALLLLVIVALSWLGWKRPWRRRYQSE
ncbi:MAG: hypothetical protein GY805_37355 [Chloroflexi bacterium]|nr:hypothetical protein [Chloroflexota bacterium]